VRGGGGGGVMARSMEVGGGGASRGGGSRIRAAVGGGGESGSGSHRRQSWRAARRRHSEVRRRWAVEAYLVAARAGLGRRWVAEANPAAGAGDRAGGRHKGGGVWRSERRKKKHSWVIIGCLQAMDSSRSDG
jgi:hypothetical protein